MTKEQLNRLRLLSERHDKYPIWDDIHISYIVAHIDEQQVEIDYLMNLLTQAADLLQEAINGDYMPRPSDLYFINAALSKALKEVGDD